jgi:protocatechuate 3,4-dioxygenase beta subunit
MKQRMFMALSLALFLSAAPGRGAVTGIPVEGALQMATGVSAPAAEVRSLSDPERTPAVPLAVAAQGASVAFQGAVPEPRLARVVVRAEGAAAMALDLLPLVEESILPPIDLAPARRLLVRVTDPAGRPVVGADVSVLPATTPGLETPAGWRPAPVTVKTGADGSALLAVAPASSLRLTVAAAGFPLRRQEVAPTAAPEIGVRLASGVPRTIEARTGDGKPAQGVALTTTDGQPLGVTDAAGHLIVTTAAGETLALRLQAADGRWARGALKPTGGGAGKPVPFVLAAPEEIHGQVVDRQTRKPLVGALVWVEDRPATLTRTDAAGRYALRLPGGGEVRVRAAAAGYLAEQAVSSPAATPRGSRQAPALALAPAAALQGLVVDTGGKPLAGVELRAASTARRASDVELRTRTRTPGAFRLSGLKSGDSYRLIALHEGFVPFRLTVPAPAAGTPPAPLRIVLDRGRAAAGRVVDGAGKPVAGAEVRLLPAASDDPRIARETTMRALTDAAGAFRIDRLSPGAFDLRARAQGFAPTLVRRVSLPAGAAAADLGTLVLERGATLDGRVVDGAGNPLAGATVQLTPPSGLSVWDLPLEGEPGGWEQVTASDGAFSFAGLPPAGATVTLRALHPGFTTRILSGVAVPAPEPVLLRLEVAASLSGTVADESGEPVAGANVLISEVSPDAGGAPGTRSRPRSVGAAVSAADGHFTVDGLTPGRFSLLAAAAGYLNAAVDGLALPDGGDLAGVDVVLRQGATVQGTVFAPDGTPASAAKVFAVTDASSSGTALVGRPETMSDGDGHYRLTGVAEGSSTLFAERSDVRPARLALRVEPGTNAADLHLEAGTEISGLVTARGTGVPGAAVRLLADDDAAAQSPPPPQVSAPDGTFRFAPVGDGRYKLVVEKPGYTMVAPDLPVRIAGVSVTGLEIVLDRGGAVTGRIVGLEFQDLAHVQVVATSPAFPGQAGTVGYDGSYRVDGLAPGAWTLVATLPANGRRAGGNVTLGQGQAEALLDLEFAAGFVLTGRVESRGAPVPGALVLVEGADGSGGDTVTTADGRFRVEGLHPGTYVLTVLQTRTGLRLNQSLNIDADRDLVLVLPAAPAPAQPGAKSP